MSLDEILEVLHESKDLVKIYWYKILQILLKNFKL